MCSVHNQIVFYMTYRLLEFNFTRLPVRGDHITYYITDMYVFDFCHMFGNRNQAVFPHAVHQIPYIYIYIYIVYKSTSLQSHYVSLFFVSASET